MSQNLETNRDILLNEVYIEDVWSEKTTSRYEQKTSKIERPES